MKSHYVYLLIALLCSSLSSRADTPRRLALKGIQAYYEWIGACLESIEADLPAISASAEAAAKFYLQEDCRIYAAGDFGIVGEAVGRSGGMIRFRWGSPIQQYLKGQGPRVVFIALREDQYAQYLAQAREHLSEDNAFVVLMGPRKLLDRAKADGFPMASAIENHAAVHEGLFAIGEETYVVPTSPVASLLTLWVWTAEFVAASTREGNMPVMYQSYAIPGARERVENLKDVRFEAFTPPPIGAGTLGRAFLHAARADLDTFFHHEKDKIAEVAVRAFETKRAGHGLYAFLHGHAIVTQQLTFPSSPNFFTQLNHGWFEQKREITLTPGDFVFCVGYSVRFHNNEYKQWDDQARESGATLAWSFTDYEQEDIEAVKAAGEIWINQHWNYGDAVVEVPGLEFKLFPTSGLIAQAVLRLVESGLTTLHHAEE